MDLLIYDEEFKLLDIVDTGSSVIWANRFRQCGDFELYIPTSADLLELLQEDRFVGRPDDDMLCIIEKVVANTDEENGDYMTVTGRCVRSILDRRIVWEQTALNDTVENVMRRLVTDAFISPAIAARKYDKLVLAPPHGYTETISTQYTGDNILEAIEKLCTTYNYGFKITLQGGLLVLDFYKATDRSKNQEENTPIIFSEEYDNLTASTYTKDKTAYKSVALVAGEGEGSARRRTVVGRSTDQAGLHRRELFVDAKDISSNDGEITDTEYMAQLSVRGHTAITQAAQVESMEGTVEPRQMYKYGTDYYMGDIVSVVTKYGIQSTTQVLEVVESWDENGYECTPTFG